MAQTKKYIINADIIRIIAGLAVVFIHVSDPFLIYPPYYGIGGFSYLFLDILNAASRVCVPLFILLSGFLLLHPEKEIDARTFYKRRANRILIPFIIWIIAYFIFLQPGIHMSIFYILSSILTSSIGVLYFLLIIFWLYMITPFLVKFLQHTGKFPQILFFVGCVLLTIGTSILNAYVPQSKFITGNAFTIFIPYISYYLGGYYLRNITFSPTQNVFLSFAFWVALLFAVFSTDTTTASVVNAQERQFTSATVLVMSFLAFAFLINNATVKRVFSTKFLQNSVKLIAGTIFGIYLLHPFIIYLFDTHTRLIPGNIYSPMLAFVFVKLFLVFTISFCLVAIGRKIPALARVFGE